MEFVLLIANIRSVNVVFNCLARTTSRCRDNCDSHRAISTLDTAFTRRC